MKQHGAGVADHFSIWFFFATNHPQATNHPEMSKLMGGEQFGMEWPQTTVGRERVMQPFLLLLLCFKSFFLEQLFFSLFF